MIIGIIGIIGVIRVIRVISRGKHITLIPPISLILLVVITVREPIHLRKPITVA